MRYEQELDKKIEKSNKKPKKMLYADLFRNQRKEIMYFIMNDGSVINVTSKKRDSIKGETDIKVGDIKTVIHNHQRVPRFSKTDKDFYSYLLGKGFKGKFLLYCNGTTYKKDLEKPKETKKEKQLGGRSPYGQAEGTRGLSDMVSLARMLQEALQRRF